MHNSKRRRGTTLVELLGVMVVIAILIGIAGVSVAGNVKRSNREAVVNELQLYATSLSDAYYDLGAPSFAPGDEGSLDEFKRYLAIIQSEYLSVTFDMESLVATATGFEVDISTPVDVYETPYHCWFVTDSAVMSYIMVASGGENCQIDSASYTGQNYGDDIVLVVRPKV